MNKKGESKLAYQHYVLVRLIREENQWKIPSDLQHSIDTFQGMPVYKLSDKKALLDELTRFWYKVDPKKDSKKVIQTDKPTQTNEYTGTIRKMLTPREDGKSGFITKDSGGDVFFFVHSDKQLCSQLMEGMKVKFQTEPDKRGKGDRAIRLRII